MCAIGSAFLQKYRIHFYSSLTTRLPYDILRLKEPSAGWLDLIHDAGGHPDGNG